ncbi:hypothetical protein K458DRAFT_295382 [Lentithecium fluviatile CBS 122367]|uniref:Sensitive to high expression protein 9, mitochondrial n=1 Tax=Lentithecium fluviatile CBS 122367 TaxID=1168545 RepID=A0A6G1JDB2_9PLEO|nr:hypothetical protein K458DRAFT_295382 [Lentithecium fluviatile CBS 122367]
MRPLLQHASRSVFSSSAFIAPSQSSRLHVRTIANSISKTPSICVQCQHRTSIGAAGQPRNQLDPSIFRRRFHQTPHDERRPLDEKEPLVNPSAEPASEPSVEPKPTPGVIEPPPTSTKESTKVETGPTQKEEPVGDIPSVPAEDLPSHREAQRWDFSKRLTELMDDLLPKLAVVTQKVNTLTGTDYSGIEALKREIKEHEKLVKQRRAAIEEAKQALDAAHAQQASSQKEVVALLERKHSWSATDLERYMSLIRSEHVNDQAVREAKEAIATAENALEEARAQLERRERAQYHEEQIWSDTIRRNSTWVTFGLMGLNIFLLLSSLVIFEPWRRRRMVREVKNALEAHRASLEPAVAIPLVPQTPAETSQTQLPPPIAIIETEIDKAIELDRTTQVEEAAETSTSAAPAQGKPDLIAGESLRPHDATLDTAIEPAAPGAAPLTTEGVVPQEAINISEEVKMATEEVPKTWQEKISYVAHDVISDRLISMRRVDFTAAMLQSAAAGAVIAAAAIAMLRPR